MALARITNYVDGNLLTGAQLNNEFDNILNNGPALISAAIPSISIVQGLTGSIISNVGSFAANGYQMKSTSTIASLTATSSYNINTQTVGPVANGRDKAAVFDSTDVHFYAITTGGTSTVARGICSSVAPPTGPTLPTGYTAWAYLASAKYSTATSAVFIPSGTAYYVRGSRVSIDSPPNSLVNGTEGFSVAGEVTVSLTSVIPEISPSCLMNISQYRVQTASAGATVSGTLTLRAETAVDYIYLSNGQAMTSAGAFSPPVSGMITYPLRSTQSHRIYYEHGFTAGTSAGFEMDLVSYQVPNGDAG